MLLASHTKVTSTGRWMKMAEIRSGVSAPMPIERKHEEDFLRHSHVLDFGGVMKKYYSPNNSSAGSGREE